MIQNLSLYLPQMNTMMAEDCNTPALRRLMNFQGFQAAKARKHHTISRESNEVFLRMLTSRA